MALDFQKAAPGDTIKVLVTSDTVAARRDVFKGQILDLGVEDAMDLLRSSKAVRYTEPPKPPVKVESEVKPPVNAQAKADDTAKDKPKDKAPEATKGGNK